MTSLPAWPASRIQFLTPSEWKSSSILCSIRYDELHSKLSIVSESSQEEVLDIIDLKDCIGVQLEIELNSQQQQERTVKHNEPTSDVLIDRQGSAVLTLYCYPQQDPSQLSWKQRWGLVSASHQSPNPTTPTTPNRHPRVAQHRRFVVAPSEDLRDVSQLAAVMRHYVTGRPSTTARHLIVVNPRSGSKKIATHVANTIVQPMLLQAGIESDIVVTTHAKHAVDMGKTKIVGNGKTVDDYDAVILMGGDGTIHEFLNGILQQPNAMATLKKLRLGIVGCGSANGFAKSITYASHEAVGPLQETFLICKGHVTSSDISTYTTQNNTYTSFLTFSWGMVADVDIDSEYIHCLGEARFDLWGARCILSMRHYHGRLSYTDDPNPVLPSTLGDPIPDSWSVIEDDFILFWASHVSHAAMTSHNSPQSRLQDGVIRIFMVRKPISRYRAVCMLLGLETGKHLEIEGAEYIACTAYRLEPQGSYNDLDGEVIESGPIQAHIIPGVLNVFAGPSAK